MGRGNDVGTGFPVAGKTEARIDCRSESSTSKHDNNRNKGEIGPLY